MILGCTPVCLSLGSWLSPGLILADVDLWGGIHRRSISLFLTCLLVLSFSLCLSNEMKIKKLKKMYSWGQCYSELSCPLEHPHPVHECHFQIWYLCFQSAFLPIFSLPDFSLSIWLSQVVSQIAILDPTLGLPQLQQ